MNRVRGLVSKKKNRFKEDGFDLDLTYITPRIIAMGYPSAGREAMYRNKLSEVQKFLAQYHQDHCRVYNLCSEREYPDTTFNASGASCVRFGFDDHNAPTFKMLVDTCRDMKEYLDEDEKNTVAIHCKAGKGRTGTVIAAYFIFSGDCKEWEDALNKFGLKRTSNGKGVTIPSQQRYVNYMREYVNTQGPAFDLDWKGPEVTITKWTLFTSPKFDQGGGCDPYFVCEMVSTGVVFNQRKTKKPKITAFRPSEPTHVIECNVPIRGDVKITFMDRDRISKDDKMFVIWLNTNFIHSNKLTFPRLAIDKANKDKGKHFDSAFQLEVELEGVPESSQPDINTMVFTPMTPEDAKEIEEDDEEEEGDYFDMSKPVRPPTKSFTEDPAAQTSLLVASMQSEVKTVTQLISEGVPADKANGDGYTSLMWASANGPVQAVQALLEAGARINHQSKFGDTPLMWASNAGKADIVKLLLDNNADATLKNSLELNAYLSVKYSESPNQEVLDLLKAATPEDQQRGEHELEDYWGQVGA